MVKDFPGGEGVEVTVTERDCEPVQVLCCEKVSEFEKESEDESESDGAGLSEPRDADTVHEAVTTFESEFWLGLREEVSSTLRDTLSEGSFVSEKLAVAVRVTVTDTLADSRVRDLEMESVFVALSLKDLDLLPIVTVREGPDFENDVELDSDVVTNAENVPDNDFESVWDAIIVGVASLPVRDEVDSVCDVVVVGVASLTVRDSECSKLSDSDAESTPEIDVLLDVRVCDTLVDMWIEEITDKLAVKEEVADKLVDAVCSACEQMAHKASTARSSWERPHHGTHLSWDLTSLLILS
jgi:hypothetical protein